MLKKRRESVKLKNKTLLMLILLIFVTIGSNGFENRKCLVDGKKINPNFSMTYRGKRYAFCSQICLNKFFENPAAILSGKISKLEKKYPNSPKINSYEKPVVFNDIQDNTNLPVETSKTPIPKSKRIQKLLNKLKMLRNRLMNKPVSLKNQQQVPLEIINPPDEKPIKDSTTPWD